MTGEHVDTQTGLNTGDFSHTNNARLRLMVVDDHEVVRKGLALVLALEPDILVCAEAGSGLEAVRLAQQIRPDLILMDYKMPGMNGVEAAKIIKASWPGCKILILTGVDADATIFEALESGIDGYILKEVPPDELIRAIRAVAVGQAYLHPAVTRKVLARLNKPASTTATGFNSSLAARPYQVFAANSDNKGSGEGLSEREREVLVGAALGRSNREIAENLMVGEETVRSHFKSTFRKLNVNDRTQAVVVALKRGLIEL